MNPRPQWSCREFYERSVCFAIVYLTPGAPAHRIPRSELQQSFPAGRWNTGRQVADLIVVWFRPLGEAEQTGVLG